MHDSKTNWLIIISIAYIIMFGLVLICIWLVHLEWLILFGLAIVIGFIVSLCIILSDWIMKIKKVSSNTFDIIYKDKTIGNVSKYDLERLFNSQIGTSIIHF